MSEPVSKSHNQPEYSVTEIALGVKHVVEENFGRVRVRGEISQFKVVGSGHGYFSLKDDKSVLSAVIWKGSISKLAMRPEDGLEVIATGKVTTYPGRSQYQLVVDSMEVAGEGALLAQLEKRKKMLEAEGLFAPERKKALPFLPEVIGVITSPTGAVIRDILHRLGDRFPRRVIVWPVLVQGEGAKEQIAAAIRGFNALPVSSPSRGEVGRGALDDGIVPFAAPHPASPLWGEEIPRPDVIIVARGGGSIEDLWAFNEEIVVRAAAASNIPLISAVGHETDTTLIDFVSDRRAPTPTAAAEMAVPVRSELIASIEMMGSRAHVAVQRKLQHDGKHLEALAHALPRPQQILQVMVQRLDDWSERLDGALPRLVAVKLQQLESSAQKLSPALLVPMLQEGLHKTMLQVERMRDRMRTRLTQEENRVALMARVLETMDVRAVMKRGFALVRTDGKLVTRAGDAAGAMQIEWADGVVDVVKKGPEVRGQRSGKKSGQGDLF